MTTVDDETISCEDIPKLIRMGQNKKAIKIIKPKAKVILKYEQGLHDKDADGDRSNTPMMVKYSAVGSKLVTDMDTLDLGERDIGTIRESWPCRWVISEADDSNIITSYTPSKEEVSPIGTAGRYPVTTHPMNNLLFDQISSCENLSVKDIVIGVHRGPRGLSLRYQTQQDEDVVFGRIINTKGIVHKISNRIINKITNISNNWKVKPFDSDCLRIIQHHFETKHVCTDNERYGNRDLTNILLLQFSEANGKLPITLGEAIDFWANNETIDENTIEKYLSGLQESLQPLVKESLEKQPVSANLQL